MKPSKTAMTVSPESIDKFRSSLYAAGRSEHTIKAYTTDLRMLLLDNQQTEIPLQNLEQVASMWLTTTRKVVSPKTTTRRLTSIRAYGKWAGLARVLPDYKAPVPAKSEPHPLPEGVEGVRRLIAATNNDKQKALLALCGLCGCRVGEALAVRPSHFDLNTMQLTIRGKGDKTRRVPVSPEAWEVLSHPVALAFVSGDALVVGLTDRFARRVVTDLGVKAQLKRSISSHDLRATFATAVYDKTKDVRLVQILLGHASSDTTQLYLGIDQAKLTEAVKL